MTYRVLIPSMAVTAALLVAACGDDGDDTAAACDAFVAIDRELSINEDVDAGIAAVDDFVASAPDDVAREVQPLLTLLRDDPEAAFESAELVVAEAAADEYALDNCADTRVELEAVNYAFVGAPSEVDAGRVAFALSNRTQTDEVHEALLLRQNDGVAGSAHDALLAAVAGRPVSVETTFGALEQFTLVGAGLLEPPGGDGDDVFVVDLEPGQYLIACLLPVNSSELIEAYFAGEAVDGEYHAEEGMFVEFSVS